jgi:type I restriction enzyme S subunit
MSLAMHDWRTESLERIAEIRSSNVDKKSNPSEESVRLCNYMDVYSREYITADIEFMEATATAAEIQRFGIERGDVMITKDSETPDDIGIPAVVIDNIPNLVCGYHVALIRPKRDEVDPIYLAKQLALTGTARYYGRLANGSTRYGLSYKSIARTPIRLAPLPQQQRIAEILSTVDEAIEQTEALIAKTQQIKAGLMHDLFTRGVTLDGKLRPSPEEAPKLYSKSPLGWIPKEWDVRPIRELFRRRIERGRPGLPVMAVTMAQGLVPRANVDRRVETKLTPEQHLLVAEGDIAYNMMRMWQGVLGRASYDCLVSPAYVVMSPTDSLDSRFAEGLLSLPESIARFKRMSYGIVDDRLRLYAHDLVRIELAFPLKVEEQEAIADRRESVHEQLMVLTTELQKLRRLKCGMLEDLLTGRISVILNTRSEIVRAAANG